MLYSHKLLHPSFAHSPRVVNVHAPVLARFVPSLVSRVGAKDEQETQRGRCESKGRQWQSQEGHSARYSRVLDALKVRVSTREAVPETNKGGHGGGSGDFAS